jgi:hypothetical protein
MKRHISIIRRKFSLIERGRLLWLTRSIVAALGTFVITVWASNEFIESSAVVIFTSLLTGMTMFSCLELAGPVLKNRNIFSAIANLQIIHITYLVFITFSITLNQGVEHEFVYFSSSILLNFLFLLVCILVFSCFVNKIAPR